MMKIRNRQHHKLANRFIAITSLFALTFMTYCAPLADAADDLSLSSIPSLSMSGENVYHLQQVEETTAGTPLNAAVSTLKVVRGRSQIIKFAQPIVRISIADPQLADIIPLAPDQIMINGKTRGVTSFVVWDEFGQEGIFDLYIENDSTELLKAIETIAPNEKIQVRVTDDSFILSGQVSNSIILDEIRQTAKAYGFDEDKFVNLAEAPAPQVILEVKIVEARRNTAKDIRSSFQTLGRDFSATRLGSGLDTTILGALGGVGRADGGLVPGRFPGAAGAVQATTQNVIGLAQTSNTVGGIKGLLTPFGKDSFQIGWDLLETQGKVTILAEPKLVCTHGRSANFLAGGEFPFVGSVDQNGSPIIQFKEFGVKLDFTPWISTRSGRIELKVAPEVSSLDTTNCVQGGGGTQVCGINKRSTETVVELEDGETLMISGIIQRQELNQYAQIPFIGDLPILGQFFKNSNKSRQDSELLVVVTPRIVRPGDYGNILGKAL